MDACVTALSAEASDMSGWLLMGLPGTIYLSGLCNIWIAVGLFIGTILNWLFVSARLRIYTQATNAIILPCFFEERFRDPTGLLRIVAAIIILIFFTIYASSGLVATGKLFESTFDMSYRTAVLVGGSIIIAYTFLGGYFAVCWTDVFQGMLMIMALIWVPILAYQHIGGHQAIVQAMFRRELSISLIPQTSTYPALAILSTLAWGLGYFGQPHILVRFMSAKSIRKMHESMVIAIIWVFISLAGAVVIGLVGIGMFEHLDPATKEHEKVFIYMVAGVMGPWVGGLMLAAILSAIMSTADSQLLVSASALAEDFYRKVIKRDASEKEVVWVGRMCVIVISAIALVIAINPKESILKIVAYAWGGFGAAFGPLVLFALFSPRTSWPSALLGMVTATVVLVVWKWIGLDTYMYEIVPGFAANCVIIIIANRFFKQDDPAVLQQYRDMTRALHT